MFVHTFLKKSEKMLIDTYSSPRQQNIAHTHRMKKERKKMKAEYKKILTTKKTFLYLYLQSLMFAIPGCHGDKHVSCAKGKV